MTERSTQARLAEMEFRMNQMTYMIAEREALQTNQTVAMMVEENTQARLTKMEIRLDQMTSMLVEIRNHIMVSLVDTQATPLVDLAGSKRKSAECPRDQYSPRRNWGITNEMTIVPNPSTCSMQMSKSSYKARGVSKTREPKKKGLAQRQFSPLPRPLSQLLPMLLEGHLVAKEVPRNPPPRYAGFDEIKTCDYHMGEKGHNVDSCLVLKIKVQNLMDKGMLSFKEPEPNVHQNPLPKHQGVNMINDDDTDYDYEAWREHRRGADCQFVEEDLYALFEEDLVNAVITEIGDTLALE